MKKSLALVVLVFLIVLGVFLSCSRSTSTVTPTTEQKTVAAEPVQQTVNTAKLVSDVRTTYVTLTEQISNELSDLESLQETTAEKIDKMSWMSRDARFDEEQRVKELRSSGLKQIAALKNAVASLDSQTSAQIASAKLASAGFSDMTELDEEAAKISVFIKSTTSSIQKISDFFESIEL